ncbi:MAG TPA: threonine synthase, partial [Chthoniobacteraceae bacterium]|nr:threonine synthase [Chthoniobacteraceae bacterium]
GLFRTLESSAAAFSHTRFAEGSRIVCTVTGHGLKDPDIAREQAGGIIPAKAEKDAIRRLINL